MFLRCALRTAHYTDWAHLSQKQAKATAREREREKIKRPWKQPLYITHFGSRTPNWSLNGGKGSEWPIIADWATNLPLRVWGHSSGWKFCQFFPRPVSTVCLLESRPNWLRPPSDNTVETVGGLSGPEKLLQDQNIAIFSRILPKNLIKTFFCYKRKSKDLHLFL